MYDLQNELWCGLYSSDTDRVIYVSVALREALICSSLLSSPPVELPKGKEGEAQRSTGKEREWKTSGGGKQEEVTEKKD